MLSAVTVKLILTFDLVENAVDSSFYGLEREYSLYRKYSSLIHMS